MTMRNDLIIERFQKRQPSSQRLVCDFDEKSTDDRIMMRISKHYEVQDRSKVQNHRVTRQMNLCSTCGTYYADWSLFLHMHEVHKKCICLHCHGIFPNVDKLVNHLKSKHQIDYVPFANVETLQRQSRDGAFLMCVQCEKIMTDRDPMLLTHQCVNKTGSNLNEKTLNDKMQTMPVKQFQPHRSNQNQQFLYNTSSMSNVAGRRKRTPSQKSLMLMRKQAPDLSIDNSNIAVDKKVDTSDTGRIYENGADKKLLNEQSIPITNNTTMPIDQDKNKVNNNNNNTIVAEDQRKFPKFTLKLPPKLKITNNYEDKVESVKSEVAKTQIEIADETVPVTNLNLDQPLDKINIVDLIKMCISSTHLLCIFCNHARRIAVNGKYLGLHMIAQHRFTAVVNSITAEELFPANFVQHIQNKLDELDKLYINLIDEQIRTELLQKVTIECLQCRVKMNAYKELHSHNKKLHSTSIMICIICKSSFFNYSDLLGHLCPGKVTSQFYEIPYRCYLCNESNESLPSTFRLMVHFRKKHNLCELCLEFCENQTKLASHVLKHKFNHFCYRCCIAYRNKPDIIKHLFWKHGTESKECKRCLQKKWPHIYHFCLPPATFTCEECNLLFTRPVSLKVHQRFHTNTFPYSCTQEGCDKKFVSKKLQQKHIDEHLNPKDIVLDSIDKKNNNGSKSETIDSKDLLGNNNTVGTNDGNDSTVTGTQIDGNLSKKMRKKHAKKMRELAEKSVLEQLPALNLSESDSDSDEDSTVSVTTPPVQVVKKDNENDNENNDNNKTIPASVSDSITEIKEDNKNDEIKSEKKDDNVSSKSIKDDELDKILEDSIAMEKEEISVVQNVWDNFKNFLDQNKGDEEKVVIGETKDDGFVIPARQLLYICQMDHDYLPALIVNGNADKRKRSSDKLSGTNLGSSSSSSSDSDSDSSNSDCGHGSNCSCSSSDDSSSTSMSTSSSSDDEEKSINKNGLSSTNKEVHEDKKKDNDSKTELPPEYLILETDLDTEQSDDSDTEEFYDKQPATLGNKFMKEKRRSIAEDEEETGGLRKKKKKKSKKKSREKNRKILQDGTLEQQQQQQHNYDNDLIKKHKKSKKRLKTEHLSIYNNTNKNKNNVAQPYVNNNTAAYYAHSQSVYHQHRLVQQQQQQKYYHDTRPITTVPSINTTISSSSSSSTKAVDETIRTSKRRRVPNKFYGYSSDEDNSTNYYSGGGVTFTKQQSYNSSSVPSSNLKWRKTDLSSSTSSRSTTVRNSLPSSTSSTMTTKTVPTLTIKKQQVVMSNRQHNSNVRLSSEKRNSNHVSAATSRQQQQHKQPSLITKIKTNSYANHYRSYYNNHSDYESESEGSNYVNSLIKSSGLDLITSKTSTSSSRNNKYSDLSNNRRSNTSVSIDNNLSMSNSGGSGYDPSRLYCICQCPYDEVSEMIACDSKSCKIEWFHFECVGIMVPPKGQWFCPDCRKRHFLKTKAAAEAAASSNSMNKK